MHVSQDQRCAIDVTDLTDIFQVQVFAKKLGKLFFEDSYFVTITNEYETDLSRDKPSIDVLYVVYIKV